MDSEVIRAAKQGDKQARDRVLAWLLDELVSPGIRRLGFRAQERFDELVQEIAVDILTKLSTHAPEDPEAFTGWAWSFVRTEIRTLRRDAQREHRRYLRFQQHGAGQPRECTPPERRALEAQRRAVVRKCLDQLPPIYQRALRYNLRDLSYGEVADLEDISEAAARQRLSKARKLLAAAYEKSRATQTPFR